MVFHDIEQNTEEWLELKKGRFSASSGKSLLMGKTTAGYKKLINTIVYERLVGERPDDLGYSGGFLKRGHDEEPEAVKAYERATMRKTYPGGFFTLGEWLGASPDRRVGNVGLLEAKAPAYNTMIEYLAEGTLPKEYHPQTQIQLNVSGKKWVDFIAYHPKLPIMIIRVFPDEEMQSKLRTEFSLAIKKAEDIIKKINNRK